MAVVKKHIRKKKNGATVVKQHKRKSKLLPTTMKKAPTYKQAIEHFKESRPDQSKDFYHSAATDMVNKAKHFFSKK